jgi:hypothetical protein
MLDLISQLGYRCLAFDYDGRLRFGHPNALRAGHANMFFVHQSRYGEFEARI